MYRPTTSRLATLAGALLMVAATGCSSPGSVSDTVDGPGGGKNDGSGSSGDAPGCGQQGVDQFGVKMLFPTNPNGSSWFMDASDLNTEPLTDITGTVKHVSGDVWNGKNSTSNNPPTFRVGAQQLNGYSDSTSQPHAEHHAQMAMNGFMQDDKDWRNIEMTGYFKVNTVTDNSEEITMYARGGRHSDNTTKVMCQGTAYKTSLKYAGGTKFAKEHYHNGGAGYSFPTVTPLFHMDSIIGKWVGMKTVMMNVTTPDNKPGVRLQVYLDTELDQNWRLWYEIIDSGQIQGKSFVVSNCGADAPNELITWGGPVATFRIDSVDSIDFKWLSIREVTDTPDCTH